MQKAGSVNAVKWPNQSLGLGLSTALNLGAAQLYVSSDNIGRWNVSKSKAADFKFGLNFTFGRSQKKEKKQKEKKEKEVVSGIENPR